MRLIRKLALAGVAAISLLLPAAATAQAHDGHGGHGRGHGHGHRRHAQVRYFVYYRACPHEAWACYGYTACPRDAHYYAGLLRAKGYDTFVSRW